MDFDLDAAQAALDQEALLKALRTIPASRINERGELVKGDTPGHEFHGNQYGDGGGGGGDDKLPQLSVSANDYRDQGHSAKSANAKTSEANRLGTKAAHSAAARAHASAARVVDTQRSTGAIGQRYVHEGMAQAHRDLAAKAKT